MSAPPMNILTLLAELRQFETLYYLSPYVSPEAKNYMNGQAFLFNLMVECGLIITPVASLDAFMDKARQWKISTVEKVVTDELENGTAVAFLQKFQALNADRAGSPASYKSVVRVTSMLVQLALRLKATDEWKSCFDALAGSFNDNVNGALRDTQANQNDLKECIRVCKNIIEVALFAGDKIPWLMEFRNFFRSEKAGQELTQLWFDKSGDVALGIQLQVDGGNIDLTRSNPASSSVENVAKNAHRIFWQLDVVQNGRAFALKRSNLQLFNFALTKDPILAFADQNNLPSLDARNPQHQQHITNFLRQLISDGKYDHVVAYLRLGFFPIEAVKEILGQGLQIGFCEVYDVLVASNAEAGKTWKNPEIYDFSHFKSAYDECMAKKASGGGSALPTPTPQPTRSSPTQETREAMVARHSRELQEREALEKKLNDDWGLQWNAGDAATKQRVQEMASQETALWPQQRQEIIDRHARELASLDTPKLGTPTPTPTPTPGPTPQGETKEQVLAKYDQLLRELEEDFKKEEANLMAAFNATPDQAEKDRIIAYFNNLSNNVWPTSRNELGAAREKALSVFA